MHRIGWVLGTSPSLAVKVAPSTFMNTCEPPPVEYTSDALTFAAAATVRDSDDGANQTSRARWEPRIWTACRITSSFVTITEGRVPED